MNAAMLLGAIYGFLGVAFGAFGAHALRARLTPDLLQIWRTAVEYQFYHALALLFVGLWLQRLPAASLKLATVFLALGILLFSGSLYGLVLSGVRGLGAVTPIGGLLFLGAWLLLIYTAWRQA